MRLFFALWPDENTRARLSDLQHGLKGRKTKRANLHITLAFLGEQPEAQLPILRGIVNELVVPEMSLVIDRIAYFKRQRIAWAGMHHIPEPLHTLHQSLHSALVEAGIAFDQRNDFKPHFTLARDAAPPDAIDFEPIVWPARQVSLVHSVAEPTGVSYHVLASQFCNAPVENREGQRKEQKS